MRQQRLHRWFLVFFLLLILSACSGSSSTDEEIAGAESIYDPEASVGAVSFADACGIEVFMLGENDEYLELQDGTYVEPGVRKIGIRLDDETDVDRIFFSDGGVYQVEAFKQGDLYSADFNVSEESLYQNILVQVIHSNGRASKEKVVLRTVRQDFEDQYIKNGVGLLISREILDGQRYALAEQLDGIVRDVFRNILSQGSGLFTDLGYGDADPATIDIDVVTLRPLSTQTRPQAVFQVSLIVQDVHFEALPLYGENLVTTTNNDLAMSFYLAIEDAGGDGSIHLVLDFSNSVQLSFLQDFFMKSVVEEMLISQLTRIELPPFSCDLSGMDDEIIAALPENILVNGNELDLDVLFDGLVLDLNKYLFADIYGIPADTTAEVLSIGLGLYVADYDEIVWDSYDAAPPSDAPDIEGVFEDLCVKVVNAAFEKSRQTYEGLITKLSYGDDNPTTPDFIVNFFALEDTGEENIKTVHLNYTVKNVDLQAVSLFGFSVISTENNDLTIDSSFFLEHRVVGTGDWFVLAVQDVSTVNFEEYFVGRQVIEEMIKTDLADMDATSVALDNIISDIDLNIDFAAVVYSGEEVPLFPDVSPYTASPTWELVLSTPYNIAGAISQHNINWVMAALLDQGVQWDVYEVLVALLGEDFDGFNPERSQDGQTILRLSVPPVIDVRTAQIRVLVNDVILQYLISGEPQWEVSVDLDLVVEPRVEGGKLNFYLTQIPQNNHFHVMRDNPGNLGIFDHSSLVSDVLESLPQMLGGEQGDPLISFDLDAFGPEVVFEDIDTPLEVSAGGGYLYFGGAVSRLDLKWFLEQGL